jgi:hypothetical protein
MRKNLILLEEIAKICLVKPLNQARLLQRINHLKMDDWGIGSALKKKARGHQSQVSPEGSKAGKLSSILS